MACSFRFLVFCSLLLLFSASSAARAPPGRPKALVLRVAKDAATLQYVTHVAQRTPRVPVKLTLDLGGEYIWVDCERGYASSTVSPLPCASPLCRGRLFGGARACMENDTVCMESPYNPISSIGTTDRLAVDFLSVQSTDGSNPGRVVTMPKFIFACASTLYLQGLASGVTGMAGLGRSNPDSPPLQFASALGLQKKFALCLSPSTSSDGVVFFGDGPYIMSSPHKIDVSKNLIYTPLILNRENLVGGFADEPSAEYFIGVNSIKVGGKPVPLNTSLLTFDRIGFGGTKISTVNPYTVLERSIYNAVVGAFVKALGVKVHRVKPVKPFGACFSSKNIAGTSSTGPAVPPIDLVLQSQEVYWRIYGANSMVRVSKDVLCLGFVDGGLSPITSIVIGGHQIEDNLLQFDLASQRLGFSSSLLLRQTSCSNFNFTTVA